MTDETNAAEFMRTFIRLTREHHEAVTKATLVSSALLQAVAEKMPAVYEAYERHLKAAERDSPLAETSRRIVAQLDEFVRRMKP